MGLTYGSLFAGVGGFDLGFDAAGWDGRWQIENNIYCQDVLAKHWPQTQRYENILHISGRDIEPVDAVLFGFPCQDVTFAQYTERRFGLSGDRTSLFYEAVRIIQEMRNETNNTYPRYAVAENVSGLLSAESGSSFFRVLEALAELGAVAIEWRMLDAQVFGLPQQRRRVFLVACFDSGAESRPSIFPQPKSLSRHDKSNAKTRIPVSTQDAGGDGEYSFFKRIGNRTYRETSVASTLLASAFGRSETLVVANNGGSPSIRRLTPLECERLQGWPDFHTLVGASGKTISDTQRYRMTGNGVAAPVAQWVAQRIAKHALV